MKKLLFIVFVLSLGSSAFGAAKIQNADVKSRSEVGNVNSRLINDTKLYSTVSQSRVSKLLENLQKQVVSWSVMVPVEGDANPWIRIPYAHTIDAVYAVTKTAGSSATSINIYRMTQADINGSTATAILSTPLTLNANERTSDTATPAVISSAAGATSDHYKMMINTLGGGAAGITVEMVIKTAPESE